MASRLEAVRRARPEDANAVADVFLAARAAAMPYLPDLHTPEETRAWMRDVVLGEHDVHVAEVDGVVGGFLALGPETVEHLYVRPELQGRGIGPPCSTSPRPSGATVSASGSSSGMPARGASTSGTAS